MNDLPQEIEGQVEVGDQEMTVGQILSILSEDVNAYIGASGVGGLAGIIRAGNFAHIAANLSESDYKHLILFDSEIPMFHELPYRVQLHLPSLLTRQCRRQVTYDHYHYWAWTAEVVSKLNARHRFVDNEIAKLFKQVVDFSVCSHGASEVAESGNSHAKRALLFSFRAATQLCYPLLEGLLRRLCDDYVHPDGRIKSGATITRLSGSELRSGRVNNVGDLLYHYENEVADNEMSCLMESIRLEMEVYSPSDAGYSIINNWRNPNSHGGERLSGPEHAVLLSWVCQLIWGIIPRDKYQNMGRQRYTDKILGESLISELSFMDYYPLSITQDLIFRDRAHQDFE